MGSKACQSLKEGAELHTVWGPGPHDLSFCWMVLSLESQNYKTAIHNYGKILVYPNSLRHCYVVSFQPLMSKGGALGSFCLETWVTEFCRQQGVCGAEVCNHNEDPSDCWALAEQDTVGRWDTADQKQNHLGYGPLFHLRICLMLSWLSSSGNVLLTLADL